MAIHARNTKAADADVVRAYRQVLNAVRGSIDAKRLLPGTVLLEGPVADIFGLSRSPVRQAFEQLESEGVLHRFDGRGLIVGKAPPTRLRLSAAHFGVGREGNLLPWRAGWERVYDSVERELIHHAVFGQFRVNELNLARKYDLSRTVARDALVQAQTLGIITKDSKSHWTIVPLGAKRVRNLFELRNALESTAIASATTRIPAALLTAMKRRLEDVLAAYPEVTPSQLDGLEQDIHVKCIGFSDNIEIVEALKRTRCVFILSKHVLGTQTPIPDEDPFLEEHGAVLNAIIRRSPIRSSRAMLAHLRSAEPKLIDRLELFRKTAKVPSVEYIEALR